jgi:hypothetical protein
MRILFVTQIVLYPPHGGVLQRGFNLLREPARIQADVQASQACTEGRCAALSARGHRPSTQVGIRCAAADMVCRPGTDGRTSRTGSGLRYDHVRSRFPFDPQSGRRTSQRTARLQRVALGSAQSVAVGKDGRHIILRAISGMPRERHEHDAPLVDSAPEPLQPSTGVADTVTLAGGAQHAPTGRDTSAGI